MRVRLQRSQRERDRERDREREWERDGVGVRERDRQRVREKQSTTGRDFEIERIKDTLREEREIKERKWKILLKRIVRERERDSEWLLLVGSSSPYVGI